MNKFTPGPWRAVRTRGKKRPLCEKYGDWLIVVHI